MGVRKQVPSMFYNEIIHSEEKVIDTTVKNANLKKVLRRGRLMQAEELNVTRLIATARGHQNL